MMAAAGCDMGLSPATAALWRDWVAAEPKRHARAGRERAAEAFLAAVRAEPAPAREAFGLRWAAARMGEVEGIAPGDVPFRVPLFAEIVAPALHAARARRQPGAARWMAELVMHFHTLTDLGVDDRPVPGTDELLAEALDVDPGDRRAMRAWLRSEWQGVDYGLHELPALLAGPAEFAGMFDRIADLSARLGLDPDPALAAARAVAAAPRDEAAIAAWHASPGPWRLPTWPDR